MFSFNLCLESCFEIFWATSKVPKHQNFAFSDRILISKPLLSCLDSKVKYFTYSHVQKSDLFLTLICSINLMYAERYHQRLKPVQLDIQSKFKSLKWSNSAVTRHSQGYSVWPSRPQVSFSFRRIRNPDSGGPSLAVIFLLLKQLLNYLVFVRNQDNLVI